MNRASSALKRTDGVLAVKTNALRRIVTVTYDPRRTDMEALARKLEDGGMAIRGKKRIR